MFRGWQRQQQTGVIPHPDEIAHIPYEWEQDIETLAALLQFQRDGLPDDEPKSVPQRAMNFARRAKQRFF